MTVPALRFRWFTAVLSCLLLLLPAFAARQILGEQREAKQAAQIARRADDLRQMVAHIIALSEPKSSFERLIGEVANRIRWEADPQPVLDRIPSGTVRLFLFSGDGKRIRAPGFTVGSNVVSERALGLIRACASAPSRTFDDTETRFLDGFLGRAAAGKAMAENPGHLVECVSGRDMRLGGVFPIRDCRKRVRFLLALVDPTRIKLTELGQKALARVSRLAGDFYSFGLLDLKRREPDHTVGLSNLTAGQRARLLKPRRTGTLRAGRELVYGGLLGQFRVYAKAPLPPAPAKSAFEEHFFLLVGGAFLIVFLMSGFWLGHVFLPIRLQVVLLFGLAGLGGVLTLLGFAREYRESREVAAIRDEFTRSREILDRLEDRYSEFLQRQGALYRTFLRDCRTPADLPAVVSRLKRLARFREDVAVFLVTASGTILFSQEPAGPYSLHQAWGRNVSKSAARVTQCSIRERNRDLFPGKYALTDAEQTDVNLRIDREFAKLYARAIGTPTRARLGPGIISFFIDMAADRNGHLFAGLYLSFEKGILERTFLRSEAGRLRGESAGMPRRFLVLPKGREGKLTRGLSPSLRDAEDLRRLNEMLSQSRTSDYRVGSWNRQTSIMTGVPGRLLEDLNLYLITSFEPIAAGIVRLQWGFLGLSALILVFMGGLGWFFSTLLLEPLALIGSGVQNLARSRLESPVQVRTGDLLEEIGAGINAVAGELEELAQGFQIHGHLFPAGVLRMPGVSCQGWHRSPTQFGGEIFDRHPVGEHQLAFWIAGIPEFTLSSSLRLSMTKMAMRLLLEHESSEPAQVLSAWRGRFLPSMTIAEPARARLALGVYNLETGICTLAAAGDFVILFRPASAGTGGGGWLLLRPPAGAEERRVSLDAGDRLLITGGIADANSFTALVNRVPSGAPNEFGAACFAALDDLSGAAGGQPPESGQTILLLERTESPV